MDRTKKIVLCSLFIALSFVGANIKIFGTIAFDSMPAFLGTLVLGFAGGGIIGFLGHMLTALTSGFPFGIVVHLIIGISMIITMWVFHVTNVFLERLKINRIIRAALTAIVAAFVNGPVTLLFLVPLLGTATCLTLAIPLFTVSLANTVLGCLVYEILVKSKVVNKQGATYETL